MASEDPPTETSPDESVKAAAPKRRKRSPQLGDPLTSRERRCLALMALGYDDEKIGKELGPPFGRLDAKYVGEVIRDAGIKLGMGPRRMILWRLDSLKDTERAKQVTAAERRRDQLRAAGVLTPQRVQVAMLCTDPLHCDKTYDEIGELVQPEGISGERARRYIKELGDNIGPDGGHNKLIAVLHLAPLSARTTTDDAGPEPETL